MVTLKKLPFTPSDSENGVNKNAVGDDCSIKVHTRKLYVAATSPIKRPTFLPKVSDAIIGGIKNNDATIGPIGIDPIGVKQNIASIATNRAINNFFFKLL